jgi:hypothetical protein
MYLGDTGVDYLRTGPVNVMKNFPVLKIMEFLDQLSNSPFFLKEDFYTMG